MFFSNKQTTYSAFTRQRGLRLRSEQLSTDTYRRRLSSLFRAWLHAYRTERAGRRVRVMLLMRQRQFCWYVWQ